MTMNKTKSALVSLAVGGLLLGALSTSLTSCSSAPKAESAMEKNACKGMNSCKGKGGCKTGDNGCGGKNSCKGKGGCGVPVKH